MKNFTIQVFVALGIIFVILMIICMYFFITDPYNLKPLFFGSSAPVQNSNVPISGDEDNNTGNNISTESEVSGGFELSPAQVEALISLGIDPATVPTSINSEQEACFVMALGEARVAEIKQGAVPGAFEFLKAKACI